MTYKVEDSGFAHPRGRWAVVNPIVGLVESRHPSRAKAQERRNALNTGAVSPIEDGRSELKRWQDDVLIPALLEKEEEHEWCDEFDEFLASLGLERPKVTLSNKVGTVVNLTRGEYSNGYQAVRTGEDCWLVIFDDGGYCDTYTDENIQRSGPEEVK